MHVLPNCSFCTYIHPLPPSFIHWLLWTCLWPPCAKCPSVLIVLGCWVAFVTSFGSLLFEAVSYPGSCKAMFSWITSCFWLLPSSFVSGHPPLLLLPFLLPLPFHFLLLVSSSPASSSSFSSSPSFSFSSHSQFFFLFFFDLSFKYPSGFCPWLFLTQHPLSGPPLSWLLWASICCFQICISPPPIHSHSRQHSILSHTDLSLHWMHSSLCSFTFRIKPNLFADKILKSPPLPLLQRIWSYLALQPQPLSSLLLEFYIPALLRPSLSLMVHALSTLNFPVSILSTWSPPLMGHSYVTFRPLVKNSILQESCPHPQVRSCWFLHISYENIHYTFLILMFNCSLFSPSS